MRAVRFCLLPLALCLAAACGQPQAPAPAQKAPFSVVEATIADLQAAMMAGVSKSTPSFKD